MASTTPTIRVLDIFCGEGGASAGYVRAGADVEGVDTSQARLDLYPFRSHHADAIDFLLAHGHEYDFVHASPPCTGYSRGTVAVADRLNRYDRLIAATREALQIVGKPYIIENVEDARPELRSPVMLCGRMFGLGAIDDDGTQLVLDRHRLFESNLLLCAPEPHRPHRRDGVQVAGVYSGARRDKHEAREVRGGGYVPPNIEVLRALIDAPWMSERGCFLSIPPAYTEHLGRQVLDQLVGPVDHYWGRRAPSI